jgi:hypothetical protein
MVKVKATSRGYYHVLREEGDIFEVPSSELGSWMEVQKESKPKRRRKKPNSVYSPPEE